jgi:hypothetical protein
MSIAAFARAFHSRALCALAPGSFLLPAGLSHSRHDAVCSVLAAFLLLVGDYVVDAPMLVGSCMSASVLSVCFRTASCVTCCWALPPPVPPRLGCRGRSPLGVGLGPRFGVFCYPPFHWSTECTFTAISITTPTRRQQVQIDRVAVR